MKIGIISFSQRGYELGEKIQIRLDVAGEDTAHYTKSNFLTDPSDQVLEGSLTDWTREQFATSDAIIFIGACGIAVRSIAPYVAHKTEDPAVLVLDEYGNYVISLLSGHLGGANELTRIVARIVDGIPVITTATDINQVFAVDLFAQKNGCYISDMNTAKDISAALLVRQPVGFCSDFPVTGVIPEELKERSLEDTTDREDLGIYISNSYGRHPFSRTLTLVPKILTLGIGCKKDTSKEVIEEAVRSVCDELLIPMVGFEQVVSIDLKKNEKGLLAYCEELRVPFHTYTASQLSEVEGEFTSSEFVKKITGVDNVCERSAVLGSEHGELLIKKNGRNGVTVAIARRKWSVKF